MTKRVESITKTLGKLSLNELHELNRELVSHLTTKEIEDEKKNPDQYESTKALEVSFSDITGYAGKANRITLAQFQQKLNKLVNDCIMAQANRNNLVKAKPGKRGFYNWNRVSGKSKKTIVTTAEEAFEKYSGEFVISIGGKIKIYALHKKTNSKVAAKRKTERKIAKLTTAIENKKKQRRKAEKDAKALRGKVSETVSAEIQLQEELRTLKAGI